MAVQNQAAVVALKIQKVKNKIEPLFNSDFGLFSKIQKSTKANQKKSSSSPTEVWKPFS